MNVKIKVNLIRDFGKNLDDILGVLDKLETKYWQGKEMNIEIETLGNCVKLNDESLNKLPPPIKFLGV